MTLKSILFTFLFFFVLIQVKAQDNRLLVSYHQKQKTLQVGDHVRLAYPKSLLKIKNNHASELVGLRGEIDSISNQQIWLKSDVKLKKLIVLNISNIEAIKKFSGGGMFFTFVATYATLGSGAYLLASSSNTNDAAPVFAGIFSIFPAAIITADVFYPAKPRMKKDLKLSVITINN